MDSKFFRPSIAPGHLFCLGFGYSAERLAIRLQTAGWEVTGTVRSIKRQDDLAAKGFRTWLFDDDRPLDDPDNVFSGMTHLLASIPPGTDGDPALVGYAQSIRNASTLHWAGYLSTSAVYGDRNGAVAREDDEPAPASLRGQRRLAAERSWQALFCGKGVSIQVFRLSGIYGPGRNVIEQLRAGHCADHRKTRPGLQPYPCRRYRQCPDRIDGSSLQWPNLQCRRYRTLRQRRRYTARLPTDGHRVAKAGSV